MFIQDRRKGVYFKDLKVGDHFEYNGLPFIKIENQNAVPQFNSVSVRGDTLYISHSILVAKVELKTNKQIKIFDQIGNGDIFVHDCMVWMKMVSHNNVFNAVNLDNGRMIHCSLGDEYEVLPNAFLDLNNERVE